tara:strand:+ start:714 stop:857 length:144 start_codon:yes stop_codon:yes gene_type:complete
MAELTDTRFLAFLIFDVIAISIAIWWISSKLRTKLQEVEDRKKRKGS